MKSSFRHNTGDGNTGDGNTGNENSGDGNTGNWNTGNWNSGNWNSGDWNAGTRNSGTGNAGDGNTGYWNAGTWNTGNGNSGDGNTGNENSGYWNSGNLNTGFFNTQTPPTFLFNKQTDLSREEILKIKGIQILSQNYKNNIWVSLQEMTEEEKQDNFSCKTTQGYLKIFPYNEAWRLMWAKLTKEEKQEVVKIPNFNAEIFKKITGIEILPTIERVTI